VAHLRADARDRVLEAGAGGDDHVDLVGVQPAGRDRLAPGGDGHLDEGLVLAGPAPLGDADAGLDPLVVGVHHPRELVVGDPPARPVAAQAEDAGAGGALLLLDRGHAETSG
jgi:hypothetical protein